MSDQRAWEYYDTDEYFLRFLRVSPVLSYAESDLDVSRLELQTELIKKMDSGIISADELRKEYKEIVSECRRMNIEISDMKHKLENIIQDMEHNKNKQLLYIINKKYDYISKKINL